MGGSVLDSSGSEQGLVTASSQYVYEFSACVTRRKFLGWLLPSEEGLCSIELFLIKCKLIIYKALLTQTATQSTLLPPAYKQVAIVCAYIQQHSWGNLLLQFHSLLFLCNSSHFTTIGIMSWDSYSLYNCVWVSMAFAHIRQIFKASHGRHLWLRNDLLNLTVTVNQNY
jgi:hypothetical protein